MQISLKETLTNMVEHLRDMTAQEVEDFVDSIGGSGETIADVVSEAVTKNDLREILARTVGAVPSEYRKLLWANPSPTSAFSAQTISLDLSTYDDIEIFFVSGATNSNYGGAEQKFPVNSGQLLSMFAPQATGTPRPQRGLTITSTGITFTAGGYTIGTTYTSSDSYCVPVYIYGIKYVRVLPPTEEYTPPKGYGTPVLLTSYTSTSNMYTIPSDGVLRIFCTYRANMYTVGHVYSADGTTEEMVVQLTSPSSNAIGNQYSAVPVFKGQKAYIQTNNTTYNYGEFVPYTY